jgi:hypothetical protein
MALIFGSKTTRASGGISTTTVGAYTVHTFTTSANFTPATTGFVDVLAIGGGGGAGYFGPPLTGGGGGAGATLLKKMIPVTASTPYPVSIGGAGTNATAPTAATNGGDTIFVGNNGITVTASGGGRGGTASYGPVLPSAAASVPLGSGGGGAASASAGTGAGVTGVGYPGGAGQNPGNHGGGGGGAGGAGVVGGIGNVPGAGGPGVPITYFTGVSPDIVCIGGGNNGVYPGSFGNGANYNGGSLPLAVAGAIYIRYI